MRFEFSYSSLMNKLAPLAVVVFFAAVAGCAAPNRGAPGSGEGVDMRHPADLGERRDLVPASDDIGEPGADLATDDAANSSGDLAGENADLAGEPSDLATAPDLTGMVVDMTGARPADLTMLTDLTPPPRDLTTPTDLSKRPADLSVPPSDLSERSDLSEPPDFEANADLIMMSHPADMTMVTHVDMTMITHVDMTMVAMPSCTDKIKNGAETDVDCGGGTCPACATNKDCTVAADCASKVCVTGVCSQTTSFAQSTLTMPKGQAPWGVVTDDFDGDGNIDIAYTDNDGTALWVLLGRGDGTFYAAVSYTTGGAPNVLAIGDFNNDSFDDLVVSNGDSTVSLLRGRGDGTFHGQGITNVEDTPQFVNTADFDGDGRLDLVVSLYDFNAVSRYKGNGNGTFTFIADIGTNMPFGTAINDYNGDGKYDLAIAESGAADFDLFLNPKFTTGTTFATGAEPTVIVTGDINGDGKQDNIVSNYMDNTVSVFLGQNNATFSQQTTYAVGKSPEYMIGTDYNNDKTIDLVTTNVNDNTISILQGLPNGTFAPATTVAVGTYPRGVDTNDFNNDGKADLVIANSGSNSLTILLNTSK